MTIRSLAVAAALLAAGVGAQQPVSFVREILPVLDAKCYRCHSAVKQKGGLRLDGKDWKPAAMKVRLRGADRIRTLESGEATLVHDASHVTVRSSTEVAVGSLEPGSSEFEVSEGMVFVEARGARVRTVSFAGQVADSSDAGYGMTVLPDGFTEVMVKRGELDFSNAGHTVIVDKTRYAFHLIPAGIVRYGKTCVIANGVVVDRHSGAFFLDFCIRWDCGRESARVGGATSTGPRAVLPTATRPG